MGIRENWNRLLKGKKEREESFTPIPTPLNLDALPASDDFSFLNDPQTYRAEGSDVKPSSGTPLRSAAPALQDEVRQTEAMPYEPTNEREVLDTLADYNVPEMPPGPELPPIQWSGEMGKGYNEEEAKKYFTDAKAEGKRLEALGKVRAVEKKGTQINSDQPGHEISDDESILHYPKHTLELNDVTLDVGEPILEQPEIQSSQEETADTTRGNPEVADPKKIEALKRRVKELVLAIKELREQIMALPNDEELSTQEQLKIKTFSTSFIQDRALLLLASNKNIKELKNLNVSSSGGEITLTIKAVGKKGPLTVKNIDMRIVLEGKDGNIVVKSNKIEASSFQLFIKDAIVPKLDEVSKILKDYIEKEENKKVKKMEIIDGELQVTFE